MVEPAPITCLSFNQDCSCLAVGTADRGFFIYQSNPLARLYQSVKPLTSEAQPAVLLLQMQQTSNIVILVQQSLAREQEGPFLHSSDESETEYTKRDLVVFDSSTDAPTAMLQMSQKIVAVQVNSSYVLVLTRDKMFVYDLLGLDHLYTHETASHYGRACLNGD